MQYSTSRCAWREKIHVQEIIKGDNSRETTILCRVIWRQLFRAVLYEDNYFVPCYMKTIISCRKGLFYCWHWFTCLLQSVRIYNVTRTDKQQHEWMFQVASIKGISLYKRDARAVFLYVTENSDDFHMFFSSEMQRQL